MLHYVLEDQSSLSEDMLIQILRVILIKKNLPQATTLLGGAMSWLSKLQTVVALSTIEVEYMAAAQAYKVAIWSQRLIEKLGHKQKKIPVYCDN